MHFKNLINKIYVHILENSTKSNTTQGELH